MKRYVYAAAVVALGLGVALVYAGVVAGGAFQPGVILICVGIALFVAGAVVDLLPSRAVAREPVE
ncbi:MAG: hypothetical protein ABIV28_00920 [Longimicrobiales bacterium]